MRKRPISQKVVTFFHNPPDAVTGGEEKIVAQFKSFLDVRLCDGNSVGPYSNALMKFCDWCSAKELFVQHISHENVLEYQAFLDTQYSANYANLQLAAIRVFFDWMMKQGCISASPAASLGVRRRYTRLTSLSLTPEQVDQLLDSVNTSSLVGLRNRAMIAAMMHGFMNVSDLVSLKYEDYVWREDRWWFNLGKEKTFRQIPANTELAFYMNEYVEGIGHAEVGSPLFFILTRPNLPELCGLPMSERNVQRIVTKQAKRAKIKGGVTPRLLRATGLRNFLLLGGPLEKAQRIAGHKSVGTTNAYADEGNRQVIYEGDLDGLVGLLREADSGPLQDFIKRSGIFRVTIQPNELEEQS